MNPTVNTDSDYAGKRWNASFANLDADGTFGVSGVTTFNGQIIIAGANDITFQPNAADNNDILWEDSAGDGYCRIRGGESSRTITVAADDAGTGVESYFDIHHDTNGSVVDLDAGGTCALRFFDFDDDPNAGGAEFGGDLGNCVVDVAAKKLWMCTTAGAAGTAVWVSVTFT